MRPRPSGARTERRSRRSKAGGRRGGLLGFIFSIVVFAVAVAPVGASHGGVAAASTPQISFPQDEGPHANNTEWWYFTGHLAVTDLTRGTFMFEEQIVLQPPRSLIRRDR